MSPEPHAALPALSPEIWLNVVRDLPTESFEDRCYLWTDCRRVSKLFKYEIEEIFAKQLLQHYELRYDLGVYYCGARCDLKGITFPWSHLSEDREKAVFKNRSWDLQRSDYLLTEEIMSRLASKLASRNFIHPPHCLKYRSDDEPPECRQDRLNGIMLYMRRYRETSDTELPELELDPTKGELSLNWKGMLSYWYAEEKLWNSLWETRVLLILAVPYTVPTVLTDGAVEMPRTSNDPQRSHFRR